MKDQPSAAVPRAVFALGLLALLLRLAFISRVQMQFDEWLGGWHANPALPWRGSLPLWAGHFWANVRDYVASGQTVAWSAFVEALQLFSGPSVVAVRVVAALSGAAGTAAVFLLARKLLPGRRAPALAAALASAFSVAGVVFGQFADVYASAVFASALQLSAYVFLARPRNSLRGWLGFSAAALVSGLFMYTQVWLTAGIFLCGAWEILRLLRRRDLAASRLPARRLGVAMGVATLRRLVPLIAGAILYAALSGAHLLLLLRLIPWSESFRWYMDAYYPLFLRGGEGGWTRLPLYVAVRLYDLFNYHLSLVFDPGVYQPLRWNWVSLPFLVVLAAGVVCWIGRLGGRTEKVISDQLSVISKKKPGERKVAPLITDHWSLITDHWSLITDHWSLITASCVPRLLLATLAACLIANLFFLLPFGGIRQMFFLAPLFALFYGWLVEGIIGCGSVAPPAFVPTGVGTTAGQPGATPRPRRAGRPDATTILAVLLCLLPALPFALSLPGLYRDRFSRLDLAALADALDRYRPDGLIASEQNLQILEMALARDRRFGDVRWPGFPHPSDALDANYVSSFPLLSFSCGGMNWTVHGVRDGYFPPGGGRFLWVDMHISRGARYEGESMRRFYPDPERTVPAGYALASVRETPGNAPDALHQSIYWPPNSFYLYLVEKVR